MADFIRTERGLKLFNAKPYENSRIETTMYCRLEANEPCPGQLL